MLAHLLSPATLPVAFALSLQGGAKAPDVASYQISAKLDARSHVVDGTGSFVFKNPSAEPTSELYFHLYLNAFENGETLFRRKAGGRSGDLRQSVGRIRVKSLVCSGFGTENLWLKAAPHSPGDPKDRTDIRVPLPRELAGYGTLTCEFEFRSELPQVLERTGYDGDFHLVAQWYPKLAKREESGEWAHFAFHPFTEFYADFGTYEVTLDVPESYVVGSTGRLGRVGGSRGRSRYSAKAEGVHDFAWVAAPELEKEVRLIDGTEVSLLSPPHLDEVREVTWQTLEGGLSQLGNSYGSYPYETLTVVHPPASAVRAGGMEYPSFITTGGAALLPKLRLRLIELMTIHELGHQWFQSAIATNEQRWPFLDEGFTSYAEHRYLEDNFGSGSVLDLPFFKISRQTGLRFQQRKRDRRQPIATAAPEFKSFSGLAQVIYSRSALCLETLRRVYGAAAMEETMRAYATRFRFKHPSPEDFFQVVEEELGETARVQTELMFLKDGWIDLRLGEVRTEKVGDEFRTHVTVHRDGNLEFPFEIQAEFRDHAESRSLSGVEKKAQLSFLHKTPLRGIHIDRSRKVFLDENLLNNHHRVRPSANRNPRDWFLRALAALALFLGAS